MCIPFRLEDRDEATAICLSNETSMIIYPLPVASIMDAFKIKVTLKDSDPEVTRTLLIPSDASFADLSSTILAAIGWFDIGGHHTDAAGMRIGPLQDEPDEELVDEEYEPLSDHEGEAMEFVCGIGGCWRLSIEWLGRVPDYRMPWSTLIDGSGDAPPEECEGMADYYDITAGRYSLDNETRELLTALEEEMTFDKDSSNDSLQAWPIQGVRAKGSVSLPNMTRMLIMAALGAAIDKPMVFDLGDYTPRAVKRIRRSKPRNRHDDVPSVSPEEIDANPDRYLPLADKSSVRGKAMAEGFMKRHPEISWPEYDENNPTAFGPIVIANGLDCEFTDYLTETCTREVMDWARRNGFYFKDDLYDLMSMFGDMEL